MKLENGRLVLRPSMVELAGPEPDVVSYHDTEFVDRGGKTSVWVKCPELWYITDLLVVLPQTDE